ncbi:major facilitator superfamily-domain-containing protein [Xylogone sp. PMI_703]|nr:major facilitator superfamily-domain-containing protein [Xylogone sp. PMI_703]
MTSPNPSPDKAFTEGLQTLGDINGDNNTSKARESRSSKTLSACSTVKDEKLVQVNATAFTPGPGSISTIDEEAPPKRNWRFYGTFGCLALLNFVCAIDATILSVSLPTVAAALGATAIEAFWCGTSFLLCSTVFQPTWAALSHIFGRKSVILCALLLFTVGTILACVANKVTVLLVGRCIQGIGGGGLVSLTYVVLADLVTLRERGKWMALISLQWAIGTIVGPVIGGLFAEKTTWRWIFWFNLPFCVIGGGFIPICLRLTTKEGSTLVKLKAFDWVSSFLFVASATAFIIPVTWGGIQYDWSSWRTLVPLFLGVAGLLGFVLYSSYIPADPLIRRSLFQSPTSLTAYLSTVMHGIILWSLLYYIPLYFEAVKNKSAIGAGVALFPATFTSAPAAIAVGIIITKTGRYRPSIWVGGLLTTAGMGMSIVLKETTNTATWAAMLLIVGIGTGMLFSAQGFACQAPVSNNDLPFAGAMYSFFRALGQTLGVAISGVIFQNTFKQNILGTPFSAYADTWAKDASGLVEVLKTWSNVGEQGAMKVSVIHAYVDGLRAVHIAMTALSAVGLVSSLTWIKEISLDRELETDQGFIHNKEQAPKLTSDKEQV